MKAKQLKWRNLRWRGKRVKKEVEIVQPGEGENVNPRL